MSWASEMRRLLNSSFSSLHGAHSCSLPGCCRVLWARRGGTWMLAVQQQSPSGFAPAAGYLCEPHRAEPLDRPDAYADNVHPVLQQVRVALLLPCPRRWDSWCGQAGWMGKRRAERAGRETEAASGFRIVRHETQAPPPVSSRANRALRGGPARGDEAPSRCQAPSARRACHCRADGSVPDASLSLP